VPPSPPAPLRRSLDPPPCGGARDRRQRGDPGGATAWLDAAANPRGWGARVWRTAARFGPACGWRVAGRVWRAVKPDRVAHQAAEDRPPAQGTRSSRPNSRSKAGAKRRNPPPGANVNSPKYTLPCWR
jgi:hypothetical protein